MIALPLRIMLIAQCITKAGQMIGLGVMAKALGLRRKELESEFGFKIKQLPENISNRLKPINHVPPLGALVTTKKSNTWIIGVAMGICTGTKAVFLSKEGVLYLPLDYIHQAWVKEI